MSLYRKRSFIFNMRIETALQTKPSDDTVTDFIKSILDAASDRLHTLSIALIKNKLLEHFGEQYHFDDLVVSVVDAELLRLASGAVEVSVKEAIQRAIREVEKSGRPITTTVQHELIQHNHISDKETHPIKGKRGRYSQVSLTKNDKTRSSLGESEKTQQEPHTDNDSLPPQKRKYTQGRTHDWIPSESLITFSNGQKNLTPREYADIILQYCREQHLEYKSNKRIYKTDTVLKELFENKASVSKFPNKVIDALKKARMLY